MSKFLHENSKSKKGHNFVKKIEGLPPLLVWVSYLIVKQLFYSKILRYLKMSKFLHAADARAMTIPRRFL